MAGRGGMRGGESRCDLGDFKEVFLPAAEARPRGQKSPQVERREAPFPDRKGKGNASQAFRAVRRRPGGLASLRVSRRSAPHAWGTRLK